MFLFHLNFQMSKGVNSYYWNKTGIRQYEFDFLKTQSIPFVTPEIQIFYDMLSIYYEYWMTSTQTPKIDVLSFAQRVRQVDDKGDASPIVKFVTPKIGKRRTEKGLELAMTRAVELAWKSL